LIDAKGYGWWDYYMEDVDSWEIGFDEISEGVGPQPLKKLNGNFLLCESMFTCRK
jgi:hypothetical protein